jgi:hypothetical protein
MIIEKVQVFLQSGTSKHNPQFEKQLIGVYILTPSCKLLIQAHLGVEVHASNPSTLRLEDHEFGGLCYIT